MIAFFVTMGVVFTALLVTVFLGWIIAAICDPLDRALWRAICPNRRSDIQEKR